MELQCTKLRGDSNFKGLSICKSVELGPKAMLDIERILV